MKIGIFGGSFNPPHHDHEQMAKQLLDRNLLDRVIFVPTSNYYPKKGLIDDLQRYELLKIMINGDERLEVSKYEFGRLTYTYQTLEHFQKEYPNDEIYFICGSDNLKELDTWKEYQKILSNFYLLVVPREDDICKLLEKYQSYQDHIKIVDLDVRNLSSTNVRKLLQEKNYEEAKKFIDERVLDYIIKNNLYQLLEKDSKKS